MKRGIGFIFCAVVTSCGNLSAPERDENALTYVYQGEEAYKSGDYDKALSLYNKALEIDQKNEMAFTGKAWVYNAKAGLSMVGLVEKMITYEEDKDSSSNAISNISGIIFGNSQDFSGLREQFSQEELKIEEDWTYDHLVERSEKFKNLKEAWEVICQALPKDVVSNLSSPLDKEKCGKLGYEQKGILIPAFLNKLAQISGVYETFLLDENKELIFKPELFDLKNVDMIHVDKTLSDLKILVKKGKSDLTQNMIMQIDDVLAIVNSISGLGKDLKTQVEESQTMVKEAQTKLQELENKLYTLEAESEKITKMIKL